MTTPNDPTPDQPQESAGPESPWQVGDVAEYSDDGRSIRYEASGNARAFRGPGGTVGAVYGRGGRIRYRKRWNTLQPGQRNLGLILGLTAAGVAVVVALVLVLVLVVA